MELLQLIIPHLGTGAVVIAAPYLWKLFKYVSNLENKIASMQKEIESNEKDDTERDERLRKEFDEKLKHEREMAQLQLSQHAKADESTQRELKEFKDQVRENFRLLFKKIDDINDKLNK